MYTIEKHEAEISVKDYMEQYVNVAEFLECCKVCPNYDKVWSCPSYDFNPEDYWKKYNTLMAKGYKIIFDPETTSLDDSFAAMKEVKAQMSEELFELEEQIPGSVSLSAGNCSVCGEDNCSRPFGEPCRFPEKTRYSIESIGGNVGKTAHDLLGCDIEWMEEGKVPSHFVLVGGLLKP